MAAWGWAIGGGLDPFNQTYWVTMSVAVVVILAAVLKSRRREPTDADDAAGERPPLRE